MLYCLSRPLFPSSPPPAPRLEQYKWKAVVTEIKRIHKEGRPVLVGTTSVEKSELLSEMLAQEGIKHQVGSIVCGREGTPGGGGATCRASLWVREGWGSCWLCAQEGIKH